MHKNSSNLVNSLAVLLLLVGLGIATRFLWADIPNFKPLGGIALFAGFYFSRYSLAVLVPLAVLCISDWWLGGYQPLLKLTVYGSLLAPIFLRPVAQRAMQMVDGGRWRSMVGGSLLLGTCALGASLLFFITTNFATWVVTPWYPRSWSGLVECYISALPFLRYTVASDLIFTGMLFAGYVASARMVSAAFRPHAPSTPPPGWLAAPQR